MTQKTLAALRRAHFAALTEATDALVYGAPTATVRTLTAFHTNTYRTLRRAVQTAPKVTCEWCGTTHDAADLQPLEHEAVADWFEEHQAYDRDLKQCPRCRETWYYEAGYGYDWHD